MSFIAASDRYKDQYVGQWEEVIQNFMVQPDNPLDYYTSPYRRDVLYKSRKNNIILKDPETHRLVMTYAAKLVRSVFGDSRHEYVKARPVGYEDAEKSETATKLLRYCFSRPGVFRTFVETIVDMLLFGTSVVEIGWEYTEREMLVRSVESEFGVETSSTQRLVMPVKDDAVIRPIDVVDFYPDPSRYRLPDMSGAAKRFRMNAIAARAMAESGVYTERGVSRAVERGAAATPTTKRQNFRAGYDQPDTDTTAAAFGEMIGYEYWGEVPNDDAGSTRRVVTILNEIVVRNELYPFADPQLPFHAFTINPVQGRFYGISPAEVVRWDQSFADAVKILVAEAIVRQVHPPIAYDPDADIDVSALKAWKPDALIAARGGPAAAGTLRYDANVQGGFALLQGLKASIQETSGALGSIQGEPGPDREAATVGALRHQAAMDRPELAAMLLEQDPLPGVAMSLIRRNQQFLDSEGLARRIGEQPEAVWIGSIMEEFDVTFVGSRLTASRQTKLQAFDRLVAYAGVVPAFQAILPNQEIARYVIAELLEMPEIANRVANPQAVAANLAAMAQFGGGGAGRNGVPASSEPPGLAPAQATGA
jgi:hypothetical protein